MQTKPKHTPGPWTVGKNRVATHSKFSIRAGKKEIGTMEDHYWSREHNDVPLEQEANARLIAAAPEMLSLLEQIQNDFTSGDPFPYVELDELIKRSRGE